MTFFPPVQHVANADITAKQVVRTTTSGHVVPATTNLRFLPFDGLALSSVLSGSPVSVHVVGPVDPNILSLGDGYVCAVGTNSTGFPVRATDVTCVSAPNWIGTCDAYGIVTVNPIRKDVFDVRDFGAVPDFDYYNNAVHTDNLAAFNTCFRASRGFNAGGGITERQGQVIYCPGGYYLSGTLEIPGAFILQGAGSGGGETRTGGTILAFPKNCNGIQLRSTAEIPNPGFNSSGSEIRDLVLYVVDFGVGSDQAPYPDSSSTGDGIHSSAVCRIENVQIIGFGGNGVAIVADAGPRIPQPAGPIEFAGNADGSMLTNTVIAFCGRHGVFIAGADANIIRLTNCQHAVNWGWGFYDVGGGSHFIGCDGSGNSGNFKTTGSITINTKLLYVPNPQIPGGSYPGNIANLESPWIVGQVIAIAGLTGRPPGYTDGPVGMRTVTAIDVSTDPATITLDINADATVTDAVVKGGNQVDIHKNHDYKAGDAYRSHNTVSLFLGCYSEVGLNDITTPSLVLGGYLAQTPMYDPNTMVFNSQNMTNGSLSFLRSRGTVPILVEIGENSTNQRALNVQGASGDTWSFGYEDTRGVWNWTRNGGGVWSMGFPTTVTNIRSPTSVAFRTGLYIGQPGGPDIDNCILVTAWPGFSPTSGTWKVGDIAYNSSVTLGGFIGWVCTAGGTPGTWTTFGTIAVTNEIRSTTISTSLVSGTDHILSIGTLSGNITVTLPASPNSGDEFIIKDANGSAATYNITIDGNGHNIDANSTFIMTTDYDTVTVKYNGTKWMAL
jgi:hypothetical protein